MPTPVYLIGGTHWQSDTWWQPDSAFSAFLKAQNFDVLGVIEWSGALVIQPAIERDWYDGAEHVIDALSAVPEDCRNVIAHSHGGQLALLAAQEIQIHRLLTLGTPRRREIPTDGMIGRWRHAMDKSWDQWGLLGSFTGWMLSWNRRMPGAENVLLPGVRHAGLMTDPALFERWTGDGLIDFFRTETR